MKVVVNGELREIDVHGERLTVDALLEQLELRGRRVAVAINSTVVSRSRFGETQIGEGDHVEVIQAVGGG